MVVTANKKSVTPALYNPHNYRLYFNFTKTNFNPSEGMVGVWFCKKVNSGKEFSAVGEGVRITIRKIKAEVIHKYSEDEWFAINKTNSREEISAILNKIDEKNILALKKFVEVFGGETDYKIVSATGRPFINLLNQGDHKIMHENFIDSLPLKMHFETPHTKKVYNHPDAEFSEAISAANFLEHSALNECNPELNKRICSIEKSMQVLDALTRQIELHLEVEAKTEQAAKNLIHNAAFNDFSPQLANHLKYIGKELEEFKSSMISQPFKDSDWLKENIKSVEDGIKHRKDIEALTFDERWALAEHYLKDASFEWDKIGKNL